MARTAVDVARPAAFALAAARIVLGLIFLWAFLEATVFALIALTTSGHTWGLGAWWQARIAKWPLLQ